MVKVLALHARDPIWALVLIPAAPLPIQLHACGLGEQLRTAQSFGTLQRPSPCRRHGRSSWILASDWHSIGLWAHLWSKSSDGRSSSLCLLLSLYICLFNKNKQILKKKTSFKFFELVFMCLLFFP